MGVDGGSSITVSAPEKKRKFQIPEGWNVENVVLIVDIAHVSFPACTTLKASAEIIDSYGRSASHAERIILSKIDFYLSFGAYVCLVFDGNRPLLEQDKI